LKYIILTLIAWTALIFVSGLIYILKSKDFSYPDFWIKAIIDCKANKGETDENLNPNKIFANIAFIDTAGASNIFGAYFGIIIDAMYLGGTSSNINDTRLWKTILRGLVSLGCIAPAMLPYIFVSDYASVTVQYVFKRTLPFFLVMLILFSFVKIVHQKLNLVA
jgi:hypothetical protein